MKYYYFHGYGSSPKAQKAEAMREVLGKDNVEVPDFNLPHDEIFTLLDKLTDEINNILDDVTIVGSSLGGLYSLYISSKTNCHTILLNPALMPMLIVPKVDNNVMISAVILAQELSLFAYENYKKEKVSVWVTNDPFINHEVLTEPFFYKGVKEYIKFPEEIAYNHEFIGFKNVFEKYIKSNN